MITKTVKSEFKRGVYTRPSKQDQDQHREQNRERTRRMHGRVIAREYIRNHSTFEELEELKQLIVEREKELLKKF